MTKYHYKSEWSSSYINSSGFKTSGYNNTPPPYHSKTMATRLICGNFFVSASDVANLMGTEKFDKVSKKVQAYPGKDTIGDYRVTYDKIKGY